MMNQKLKILLVDDEQPARKKLTVFLKRSEVAMDILEAGDGIQAVKSIRETSPNLVFLDIQMPGMTGFEVIKTIGVESMPPVIFVTAYDEYAIAAFEVQAIDYLLKPFDKERFQQSFQRALASIEKNMPSQNNFEKLLETVTLQKHLTRILVNKSGKFSFVKTADIQYISAEEKYVKLHTAAGTALFRETMTNLETKLNPAQFVRIHRSFIVNLDFIKEIQPWSHGDYVVILKDNTELSMSRRYKAGLFGK